MNSVAHQCLDVKCRKMLPREEFAAAFWRVYDTLRAATEQDTRLLQQQAGGGAAAAAGGGGAGGVVVGMPSFFTFMTLMGACGRPQRATCPHHPQLVYVLRRPRACYGRTCLVGASAPCTCNPLTPIRTRLCHSTLLPFTPSGPNPTAADLLLSLPPSRAPHAVVLEVGIGGRLDATNALCPRPAVSGITSLGFDHMELLGHTLPVRAHWYNASYDNVLLCTACTAL